MYSVAGIELTTLEYTELKKTCELPTPCENIEVRGELKPVYTRLHDFGLVSGLKAYGVYVLQGATLKGREFIRDCKRIENKKEQKRKRVEYFERELARTREEFDKQMARAREEFDEKLAGLAHKNAKKAALISALVSGGVSFCDYLATRAV